MSAAAPIKPRFFATQDALRRWLEKNHGGSNELWIGFYKVNSGKKGLTYAQAVDEALCFGWIDGLVKRFDADAFMQRFTPRKAKSTWSEINIRKIAALTKAGRMAAPGHAAFNARDPARTGLYSFENRNPVFDAATAKRFGSRKKAWAFFEAQPPGYRRTATHWVMSAKREETRERRLARLIEDSAAGRRLDLFSGEKTPQKA
jgi:uncharacterized protein YdeI (YjbR/CyaY-like superfamily)